MTKPPPSFYDRDPDKFAASEPLQHSKEEIMIPSNLRYHQEHEWARVEGKQATIGISHFAQDALGDIVFIDLPKAGAQVAAGDQIGEVESTKTTSTIYTPVGGTVAKVNRDLKDHPEVVNSDPYGKGWMIVVKPSNAGEWDQLLSAPQYEKFVAEGHGKA